MTLINCGSLGGFQAVLLEQESVVKFLCEKIRLLTGPQCIFLRDYDYQQDVFKVAQSSIPIKKRNQFKIVIIIVFTKKNMLFQVQIYIYHVANGEKLIL